MLEFSPQGMGWIPDFPDPRDYIYQHPQVLPLLRSLKQPTTQQVPREVDLRTGDEGEQFFSNAEHQGELNSSSAFAALSLVEYFERRILGKTFSGSKLFLYKVARNLRWDGAAQAEADVGIDLRTTLRALQRFGVPIEAIWPYDQRRSNSEPGAFAYHAAKPIPELRSFRIDTFVRSPLDNVSKPNWELLVSFLTAGFPVAFGFSVPSSITNSPNIHYRGELDRIVGGQAALAIGFRLDHFGRGQHAIRIRTSWGSTWGDNGNGWLSFAAFRHLARDFWTIISPCWTESDGLTMPHCVANLG